MLRGLLGLLCRLVEAGEGRVMDRLGIKQAVSTYLLSITFVTALTKLLR